MSTGATSSARSIRPRQTVDFLLTTHRDEPTARCSLAKAIPRHGLPETITIDWSEANAAAVRYYIAAHKTAIAMRQVRYLKNVVEQDHRAVERIVRPILGFKFVEAAQRTLAGVELMHMLRKGQWAGGQSSV